MSYTQTMKHTSADLSIEIEILRSGITRIAGADEVGRGAFAGPVVTGVVVFDTDFYNNWLNVKDTLPFRINDSKKLPPAEREMASHWIKENSHKWAIGEASVAEINMLGIVSATNKAYRRALQKIDAIEKLLVDAFYIPKVRGILKKNQIPLVKGDARAISIAAASIIAKVHRDNLMSQLGAYPKYILYKWPQNKGYGTVEHRAAINKFGLTRYHRKAFVD
jgi:ribonuclease HII